MAYRLGDNATIGTLQMLIFIALFVLIGGSLVHFALS
jgi:hypothetical protein